MNQEALNDRLEALRDKRLQLLKMQKHLNHSYGKVSAWWSDDVVWSALTDDEAESLAAFKARFAELQDHTASAMRLLAELDGEDTRRFTYVVNYMEQLGIVENMKAWLNMRELRHKATHDYSSLDIEKTVHFSALFNSTLDLLKVVDSLQHTIENYHLLEGQ